jgi:vitamin B12 transporter
MKIVHLVFAALMVFILGSVSISFAQTVNKAGGGADAFDLGNIVVTGPREPETASFFPGQVEVVTQDVIKKSGAQNVLDLLNSLPGIYSDRDTALYGQPMDGINIRGQESFDKVAIIIDGRPDNMMNIMGHALLDPLAIDNVERIEIYKGPASVIFGSNARGGVINIITKKGSAEPEATFRQSFGSNDSYDTLFAFSDTKGPLDIHFSLGAKGTAGYLPDDPTLAGNSDGAYRGVNNTAHLGYAINKYKSVSTDWRWNQFTGNAPNSATNPLKRNRWGMDVMYENKHSKFKNDLHFYHGQGKHINFGTDGFDSADTLDGVRWTHQMQTGEKNLLLIGSDYERYGGSAQNYSGMPFIISLAGNGVWTRESRYSLFFSDTYDLTKAWSLNLGYREVHDFITGWNGVPQAGVRFRPTRNSEIGVSYSKAYYTPSLRESLFFVKNYNPVLDPEYTEQYALDYTIYKSNRLQFKTSLFQIKDTGKINTAFGNISTNSATGDETTNGFETSFTRYFGSKTNLNVSYTHLDIDDTYGATSVEHKQWAPENQYDLNLSHTIGNLNISANANWVSDIYYDATTKVDDYTLLNLHLNYQYAKGATVFFHLKNALDEDYSLRTFSSGSFTGQEWKMPGRTFNVGLEWDL